METPRFDIYHLRGILETLIPRGLRLELGEHPTLILAARVFADDVQVGWMGQARPARTREIGITGPALVAELDLHLLEAHSLGRSTQFTELAKFPGSTRDIAMFVPATLPNGELNQFFSSLTEPLLESFQVFDVFVASAKSTEELARKSIAYSLTYRDESRTLQATEIDEAHGRVLDALKNALPVEVR
ncbi:MAG: hypothetical protein O3C21_14170 [Verrucomicrobia bacterium]|nr:hypothetical protein [Verrucomicrobiota bacterium]